MGGCAPGTGNLAEPRLVNFALLAGDQFFTVGTALRFHFSLLF